MSALPMDMPCRNCLKGRLLAEKNNGEVKCLSKCDLYKRWRKTPSGRRWRKTISKEAQCQSD
jgi:hypothetical protein